MSTSIVTVSNSSSGRSSAQIHKNLDKPEHAQSVEAKPEPDEPPPKRPKRTLKLTASQRERKRAIDREAQRSIRLKTKNYIAHLENLVRIMENGGSATSNADSTQQPSGQSKPEQENERARALLSQLRQSEEEVRHLKEMLSSVQKLVGTALNPGEEPESTWLAFPSPCNGEQMSRAPSSLQGGVQDHLENCASVYSHSSDSSSPLGELGYQAFDQPRSAEALGPDYTSGSVGAQHHALQPHDLYNSFGRLSAPVVRSEPPTSDPADALKDREEGEWLFLSDREVSRALAGGPQSFTNQPLDEDIIVRAALHGWRDVQDHYLLDKGWQALRSIDQSVFRECGVVERLAVLSMMRLKLLHQSNTNPQFLAPLPPFFQRGPSEDPEILRKTPVIEHIVWPALRTCLCRDTKKYTNNKFSDSFRQSFKFLWPYEVSDAYTQDSTTQLYSITVAFKQRLWDLRSWAMRREFFAQASELIGAIPVYDGPMDRPLVPAVSMPLQAAPPTAQAPQAMHRQMPMTKQEEQDADHSQGGVVQGNRHSSPHMPGPVTTTASEIPGQHIPYSPEVEAWLGDPDLVPQYWDMTTVINVGYEAASQQWPHVQRRYV